VISYTFEIAGGNGNETEILCIWGNMKLSHARQEKHIMASLASFFLVLVLVGCEATSEAITREEVEKLVTEGLAIGASSQDIELFAAQNGMVCVFDDFMQRHQCLIRETGRSHHSIQVYFYVDREGNFTRAEVLDVFTAP